jgi:uncharacterized protein (DUF1800 family)
MPTMSLKTEREKGAHLLRRFGLGASEAELDYYLKDGLSGAIDKLLDYEKTDEGFAVPIEQFRQQNNNNLNPQALGGWWAVRLIMTQRPLQEKMTLFWHDHFATSASKVQGGMLMYAQNELLRANATGNFQTLLLEVSKDPAMLYWLDNQDNVKNKPNENFAREVMELFTLGIGNYSEKDIAEAARAFTGWSLRRTRPTPEKPAGADFLFRPALHDDGEKSVLGKTGDLGGEDVIAHLCGMPRTAEYLTLKIWEWFAYPKPEPALVSRLAGKFRADNLSIKTLLREVMKSPEFYSAKAERAVYKNPVDFCITSLRQLGFSSVLAEAIKADAPTQNRGRLAPAQAAYQTMKAMGMQLFFPPDVAGWDSGPAWITSATMVERISWADRIFGVGGGTGRIALRYPAYPVFQQDPTPKGVATKLVSVFDAPIPASKMPNLISAAQKASGGTVTPQNANATAAAVTRLIFASPEFQFA